MRKRSHPTMNDSGSRSNIHLQTHLWNPFSYKMTIGELEQTQTKHKQPDAHKSIQIPIADNYPSGSSCDKGGSLKSEGGLSMLSPLDDRSACFAAATKYMRQDNWLFCEDPRKCPKYCSMAASVRRPSPYLQGFHRASLPKQTLSPANAHD